MKHLIIYILALISCSAALQAQSLKAMDLGLSVKWANMNVGASSPEEYGDYFAWGEIDTKRYYGDYSSYKFIDSKKYKKYNYIHFVGKHTVDSLFTLQKQDDAATQNLGKNWRMPTSAEVQELFEKCIFVKGKLKGTMGFFVANKDTTIKSDTIFIPLVGRKDFGNFRLYPAKTGYYWTSTFVEEDEIAKRDTIDPNGNMVRLARCLILAEKQNPSLSYIKRSVGCAIRPVSTKKKR